MTIEAAIGESTVMVADEFPDAGIVSPLTLGGTYGALVVATDDATCLAARRRLPACSGSYIEAKASQKAGNAKARFARTGWSGVQEPEEAPVAPEDNS
jgi:hypothetical protein